MRQLKITKQVTNRDTPSLDKYLQEIGKVELISPEEEVNLARRIKSGETEALRKLVKANLRFVVVACDNFHFRKIRLARRPNIDIDKVAKVDQLFDGYRYHDVFKQSAKIRINFSKTLAEGGCR